MSVAQQFAPMHSHKFLCLDCGEWHGSFTLKRETWMTATAARERRRHLCVHCVQTRLRRSLVIEDFPDVRTNDVVRFGFALGLRFAESTTHTKRDEFDAMIGRLDRILSEFLVAAASDLDEADRQTIKHHADDLIGVGSKALTLVKP